MLLYKADEEGIIFHTALMKDLYKELIVFRLKQGTAVIWTIDKNFDKKVVIQL